jgi:hypothetical protein
MLSSNKRTENKHVHTNRDETKQNLPFIGLNYAILIAMIQVQVHIYIYIYIRAYRHKTLLRREMF